MLSANAFTGIDELVTQIYQGALEPVPWQSFLDTLRRRLDCDGAVMALWPAAMQATALTVRSGLAPAVTHAKFVAGAPPSIEPADPLRDALRRSGAIATLDEVMPRQQLLRSDYYRAALQPAGIDYQLGMCCAQVKGWSCLLSVVNGPHKPNFGDAEKAVFAALRPHLEYALKTYGLFQRKSAEKEIYEGALDQLSIGTIILDSNGNILDSNRMARELAANSSCIALSGGRLVLGQSGARSGLQRAIAQALASCERHESESFADALRIECPDGVSLWMVVRPVTGARARGEGSPSVVVYLGNFEQEQSVPEQFVARLFGLTRSEAHLAALLADGFSLSEAAKILNLTESSIRTYSKRIYAKTGVNRQGELVRLILKSVGLLAGLKTSHAYETAVLKNAGAYVG